MSPDYGKWLSRHLYLLRNWRDVVRRVAEVVSSLYPGSEVYVFGSVVEGRVTGASDIDVIVVLPQGVKELDAYINISKALEDSMGSDSYVVDLHVVEKSYCDKPPYVWWLKRAVRVL